MNTLKTFIAGAVLPVVALFMFAQPASALYHSNEVQVDTQTEGDAGVNIGGDAGVDASLETDAQVGADANTETNDSEDASEDSDVVVGTEGSTDAGLSFSINRSDVDVQADGDISAAVTVDEIVGSEAGFQTFVRQIMAADEQVEEVEVSDEEVSVSYKQRGKLFGFIPVKLVTEASVDAEGEVDIDYPWYRFATSLDSQSEAGGDVETQIESRVETLFEGRADASVDGEARLSTQERCLLVGEIYQILQSELGAEIDADVDADVEAEADANATSSTEVEG